MMIVAGRVIVVMTVNLQLAPSMNTKTITACVRERTTTLMFRQIWSDTVVVSADSLLVMSPASKAASSYMI